MSRAMKIVASFALCVFAATVISIVKSATWTSMGWRDLSNPELIGWAVYFAAIGLTVNFFLRSIEK